MTGLTRARAGALACAFALLCAAAPTHAGSSQQARFLALAEQGISQARSAFRDGTQGIWNGLRNVPLQWYDERLGARPRYPLATIWGAVPLFEALSAAAIADPSPANRAALDAFAEGAHPPARPPGTARRGRITVYGGAESYWDPAVNGYGPYPGDRGPANTWFDDNAWWGIAFMDAYQALANARFLADAQRAFDFVATRGWDAAGGGGLWWNTAHIPGGQKSGEALAAGSLLGALLAQAWAHAGDPAQAAADLQAVQRFLAWGDAHFADGNGLYVRTQSDSTPMPYVAGPQIEANELLCRLEAAGNPYCGHARRLAGAAAQRFADRLNMGPQYDVIYLHWMLVYAGQTGDARWPPLALEMAGAAQAHARGAGGLYLNAWDGSDMTAHQAVPNMLRTDAATVELFAWLAANGP
jgi:hypothetical protein